MMRDDTTMLICAPHIEGSNVIPGSIIEHCGECGREVDVAPSGQAILASGPTRLACLDCGMKMIDEDPEPEIGAPTPDQQAEMHAWRRRN